MAKQKLPAYLRLENKDKNHNNADLEKMIYLEEKLKGESNLLNKIPETLSEIGQAYYMFLIDQFSNNDILSNLDIPLLEQAADCLEKMQLLDEVLNEEGMFIEARDSRGNEFIKEHPAVKTKQTYLNQFRYVAGQLGMSPASRAQMAQAKVESKEEAEKPLNQLMKRKNNK